MPGKTWPSQNCFARYRKLGYQLSKRKYNESSKVDRSPLVDVGQGVYGYKANPSFNNYAIIRKIPICLFFPQVL
jgi:hypothetical protein